MSSESSDKERTTPQRTLMFGLLFLLLLIAAVILGYVFLGKPPAAAPTPTAALAPPAAPSDLTADVVAVFDVPVGWKDNSDNEDGFNIYRQRIDQPSGKDKAGASGKDATIFLDGGTVCGATYQYTVASYNAAGESPTTPCWQITLPACPAADDLKFNVGDKTQAPDFYLSADGTNLMSDQPGQNGVIDLGNVGSTPLDQVLLPQPTSYKKDGTAIVAGHTYAVLMNDGKSVHVLTVNTIDATSATMTGIIWHPGDTITGECKPPTTATATSTSTATATATEACSSTPNNDCVTPTVSVTPGCGCRGTDWICPGQAPISNDKRCIKPSEPPTEASTPSSTCPPNSTDPACGGPPPDCYCDVANGAWNGNYSCYDHVTGVQVSTVFNPNQCPPPVCGNGTVEGVEACDSGRGCKKGETCQSDCTCVDDGGQPTEEVCTCIPISTDSNVGYCLENRKRQCSVNR